MQELYFKNDSKGILPYDLEDTMDYLMRGASIVLANLDRRITSAMLESLDKDYPSKKFGKTYAPDEAYDFMKENYDCDVRWIPYFRATYGFEAEREDLGRFNSVRANYSIPFVSIHRPEGEKTTAIHEFIHSVRMHLDNGSGDVAREAFAEMYTSKPDHSVFAKNPKETIKVMNRIHRAHKRLFDCFGDNSLYCLIRLSYAEVDFLSRPFRDIKAYFRDRANLNHKKDTGDQPGMLRFQIMCERMGL